MNRKTISAIAGAVGVIAGALGGGQFATAEPGPVAEVRLDAIDHRLDRMEDQLERLLERD
jgi:hypothetical protein